MTVRPSSTPGPERDRKTLADHERCDSSVEPDLRCVLPSGHGGLHRCYPPGSALPFEWG